MASHSDTVEIVHQTWTPQDILNWQERHGIQRSYYEEIVKPMLAMRSKIEIQRYGALKFNIDRYPLYAIRNSQWSDDNPTIFISAGVHGCETSGIQSLRYFIEHVMQNFITSFNFLCAICVSPWGYETNNRWNPQAMDPNRQFFPTTQCDEASNLMHLIDPHRDHLLAHFDLHDTTPSNEVIFKAEYAQKYGVSYDAHPLPDGSVIIGDIDAPALAFQSALAATLKQTSPLATPNAQHKILGQPIMDEGVILYAKTALGLCSGYTQAPYRTIIKTLANPKKMSVEDSMLAQVTTLTTGLNYLLAHA